VIAPARARRTDTTARRAPCAILTAYLISWSQSGVWGTLVPRVGIQKSSASRKRRSFFVADDKVSQFEFSIPAIRLSQ
jgi:hypothetical protein